MRTSSRTRQRRGVGLADAGAPLFVGQPDDDRLARAVEIARIARRAQRDSLDLTIRLMGQHLAYERGEGV